MRKFELAIGAAALVVFSASATLYLMNHRVQKTQAEEVALGVQEPEHVLSLSELVVKATPRPEGEQGDKVTTQPAETTGEGFVKTLHPEWRQGSTRVVEARAITEAGEYVGAIWSPIGLDLAFTKRDSSALFLAGENSQSATLLASGPDIGRTYRWNPDGMSLHIIDADERPVDLTITGEKYPSPDAHKIVFERDNVIYFQPEEGEPVAISGTEDHFVFPELSPDETKVLFMGMESGIYIAFIENKTVIYVGKGENPEWLADSSGIVYDVPIRDSLSVVDGDLWYASADGRERTNMTRTHGIAESHPAVAPDGERIAFSSRGAIYVGKMKKKSSTP